MPQAKTKTSGTTGEPETSLTLAVLKQELGALRTDIQKHADENQKLIKKDTDEKLKELRKDIIEDTGKIIEQKIKSVFDYVDVEVGRVIQRVEEMEKRVAIVECSVDGDRPPSNPLKDVKRCVVVSGLKHAKGETTADLKDKVSRMFEAMGEAAQDKAVVACCRIGKIDRPYPLTKVALSNEEEKIEVLRGKQALRKTEAYKRVFIRPSKTFAERTMEANIRTLAELVQKEGDPVFKVNSQGKLIKRTGTENPTGDRQKENQ